MALRSILRYILIDVAYTTLMLIPYVCYINIGHLLPSPSDG